MEEENIKKLLLKECYKLQRQKAENAYEAMSEHQKMANEYGGPKDRYDSFRMQLLRKKDLFAEQYQIALDEISVLEKINPEMISDRVEFGALVYTSVQKIYVAISMGRVNFNTEDYYVVSTKVPVFDKMKGLFEGDSFLMNGKEIKILKIL